MLGALLVGAAIALVAAWFASPLFPFGVAGRAEPHPGLAFDRTSLLGGSAVLLLVLAGIASLSAWRATRPDAMVEQTRNRPSLVARTLEGAGLRPPATIGVGMALERGRGRAAVPVRSALVGVAVAVIGVVAVAVFATSLNHLATTPRAYGASWDGVVDDRKVELADQSKLCGDVKTRWTDYPTVEAVASVCSLGITLGGRAVGALGFTSLRGHIGPTVLEGREPLADDEVALGSETLRALDAQIGDRLTGKSPAGDAEYRVVGRVVVPTVSDPQALADGAIMTGAGLARLANGDSLNSSIAPVVRFRAGVDRGKAERELETLPGIGRPGNGFVPVATPLEVRRVEQLDRLPIALAIFLTVLGAVAVGHLLVTSVQRRQRDFAVLKSLGFGRAQTYRTVCIQATTVALVGVGIGLLVGAALGAFVWRAAAGRVGVLGEVEVPGLALVGIALATVVLANLIAAIPARAAARTPVAVTLRAD
jgi:FtsX-like permease family